MEDIPNKIQSTLGILAKVNEYTQNDLNYLEIEINPSSFPVSYHGEYFIRSGSTTQKLTGFALTEFIINKTGFHWEDVTVDNISVEDLDEESFRIFKKAALKSKRMSSEELNISNKELLEKLNLMSNGKLKRSAVLLFYDNPSIVQNGSHVQIGKFGKGSDLQYQDILEGSLIYSLDKIVDLLFLKYLKAKITYEHDQRIETYPYAREAIREAIFNAIAHNCYMYGTPIQIRVQDDSIIISNQCILPDGWTLETLTNSHESKPFNPDIANVFYRAGYIERWGRGIEKIFEACKEIGAEGPEYSLIGSGLRIKFKALNSANIESLNENEIKEISIHNNINGANGTNKIEIGTNDANIDANDANNKENITNSIIQILKINPKITQIELAKKLNISRRTIQRIMESLKNKKIIKRIGNKRNGSWQVLKNDQIY